MTTHPRIAIESKRTQSQVQRERRFWSGPISGAQNPTSPAREVPKKPVCPGVEESSCEISVGATEHLMTMMTTPDTDDTAAAVTLGSCPRFVTVLQVRTTIIVGASAGDSYG